MNLSKPSNSKFNQDLLFKSLAELIGTFALVFFGCGSIMTHQLFPESLPAHIIPVIFGLTVTCIIYSVGHISGAHLNPVVTFGFLCARHFPKKELLPYWIAQILGGVSAIAVLQMLIPGATHYGSTVPSVPIFSAFLWEVILTFFLMFVIMAVATDTRAVGFMAGVAIGGVVMLAATIGGPFTGASMNPARSIGPAIFQHEIKFLWIYCTAPFVGAFLGAIAYQKIKCEPSCLEKNSTNAKGCC